MCNRSCRITLVLLVFALFLIFAPDSEAVIRWAAAYGGDDSDFFTSLQQTTGGGYVFAPVHNIQAGVPPENIEAMFDTALGRHG